jgi:hypothetical protein
MLKNYPERAVAVFAVDFEPIVDFAKVTSAAEVLHKRLKTPHWGVATGSYWFRDTTNRRLAVVDFRRVSIQTLGLEIWQRELADFPSLVTLILQKLGISRLKRIGFLTRAYLSLGMSHREMADLMFGSYLALAQDFQEICGKPVLRQSFDGADRITEAAVQKLKSLRIRRGR